MAEQRDESASKAKFTLIPLDQLEKWKMTLKCLYGATVVSSMEEGKYDLDLSIVELPKAKILTEEEIRNKELQEKRAMVVSSQQIIKWFPKWEQSIISAATVTPKESFGVVHLPFDGKRLLELVNIAHERPTTDKESALASLANHLVETHDNQPLISRIHQLLDSDLPEWPYHNLDSLGHRKWLGVAYQFGLEEIFQRAAYEIAFLDELAPYWLSGTYRMVPWNAICDIAKCRTEYVRFALTSIYQYLKAVKAHEFGNCDKKACPCPQHKDGCLKAQKHNIHGWLKMGRYPLSHSSTQWNQELNQFWRLPSPGRKYHSVRLENLCDACTSRFSKILELMENNRGVELGLFLMAPNSPRLVSDKTLAHLRERKQNIEEAKGAPSCE
ncbi:putative Nuclear pore protein [Seiridium cardinale]